MRTTARLGVSSDFISARTQTKGTFTCLIQQVMDYPLTDLTTDGDRVHFALGDLLVFDGKVSANEIIGTFIDYGASGDFSLRRGDPLYPTNKNLTECYLL